MWSGRFLWTGLLSGIAVAALALAGIWLVLFVAFGDKDPSHALANMVVFVSPGLIVYPACWYVIIFRQRDYSLSQTMMLTAAAFGVVSTMIALVMLTGAVYGIWLFGKISPFFTILTPLAFAIWFVIGAVIFAAPYVIIALPMVLLHRWLLLKSFVSTASATPAPSESVVSSR
jgi:hypothetical protein